jgi:AAA+ superfamily predicted ATPase
MKVYLDDERSTPEGWHRVYTVDECKRCLETRQVTHLSLDNDLGSEDPETEGYQILNYLEEVIYFDDTFPIPIIFIHSSNEGRAPMMRMVVDKLDQIRNERNNLCQKIHGIQ